MKINARACVESVLISKISFRVQLTNQHVNSSPVLVQSVDVIDVVRFRFPELVRLENIRQEA